ncbi:MAG: DUF2269 family protein [Deltaproteobacteria bacterium]|nr:MAG: DUF2269 family protein [Deltaproteobacteria bacterium]
MALLLVPASLLDLFRGDGIYCSQHPWHRPPPARGKGDRFDPRAEWRRGSGKKGREETMWMKLFHILFVLWFAGGVLAAPIVRVRLKRAEGLRERVFALQLLDRLQKLLVLPGLLLAGLFGFGLLHTGGYGFRHGWVHLSIAIYLLLLLLNFAYITPQLRKRVMAAEASKEAGEETEALRALLDDKKFGMLADINAIALLLLSLLMTLKPF